MNNIAKFEKISFNQFEKDIIDAFGKIDNIEAMYDNLKLPERATVGSAGYDFCTPVDIKLKPGENIKIPTGIRSKIDDGWFLSIFPRSGLGFKYRLQLDNTVGIIDADYYNSSNEGHIMIKITNDSKQEKVVEVETGKGFAQGIFMPFGITVDDKVSAKRDGGFGSTQK